jgi:uncharacterized protein YndB with AHSA1/START domain
MSNRIEKYLELELPLSRVWQALTDYREFGTWFKVELEGPFLPGQTTRGRMTEEGFESVPFEVEVQRIEDQRRFSYSWHPYAIDPKVDYSREQPTLVEFELRPTSNGTLLLLSESGFDELPSRRRSEEAYRMHDEGWTMQMQRIARYLEQGQPSVTAPR